MEAYPARLKVVLILFFLIKLVLTQHVPPPPLSSDSERSALLNLRSSLGIRAEYWPRKANPCFGWTGVECRNGRVVGINLSGLSRTRSGRQNPRFAVDSLAKFTLLSKFNSSGFSLPGSIPDWFGRSLSALQVLDLRSSSITGPIPSALGNLSGLNSLVLSGNSLTGAIPSTLGELSSLSILNLSGNSLTGGIPSAFSALGNLSTLDLSSNFLSGPVPPALGSLSSLQFLNLYNNNLDASLPPQLGNLSQLIELNLGHNDFSGSLPEYLGRLRSLQKILVGNNRLGGSLPRGLFSNLTQLQYLALSWNNFDGNLPDVLRSMPRLHLLDVSGNNLTDVLPNLYSSANGTGAIFNLSNNMFHGTLTFLIRNSQFIDLSNNYFQGLAPGNVGTSVNITGNCIQNLMNQRSLQDCILFYTRRGLTFDDGIAPPYPTPAPLPNPASSSKKRVTYIVVGLFGGLVFIVLLVLMLLLFLKSRGKGNTDQRTGSVGVPVGSSPPPKASISLSGPGESFTYEHMLRATGDFSHANLIKHGHSGDIFHGTLEGGFRVVIKRVDLRSFKKESYMLELEFFSKASHPRLVPLLGHCLEHEYEKFLVYKYMPHGDLSNSLYKFTSLEDDSLQSLDWITRLKIAIGAAEGLSYLHHECNPPIVHREIQASSILLDDKYEVRLGSLSDWCAQEGENYQNVITRLLRMPQTSEQSSPGSSSATCAYDVYCFGKVLLGLITGKLGISNTDNANTKEWLEQNLQYISICEKEMVSNIVDKSLIVDEDLLEEVWAMAIVAKSCLHPKPWRRPLMRHILRALENPLKVVREESYNSARLRTTSSRRSWSAAFFGSWRQSSSESASVPGQMNREGTTSGLKQAGRVCSQGSGANELSSSHKRSSSEIFPEPADDIQDIERQEQK